MEGNKRKIFNLAYLSLSSLTMGWMVGMSVSPIVNTVISSVLAIIITLISILSGLNTNYGKENLKGAIENISTISLLPVALLTICLAVGSSIGIYTRTHNFLGVNKPQHINNDSHNKYDSLQHTAGLFSMSTEECQLLQLSHGNDLKVRLKAIGDTNVQFLISQCSSDSCLEAIKRIICKPQ